MTKKPTIQAPQWQGSVCTCTSRESSWPERMKRLVLFPIETLVLGLSFAKFKLLSRSTKPADPGKTWDFFTKPNLLLRFFQDHYPPKIFVRPLVRFYYRNTLMFKNHSFGISKHYDDIPCEFYELFLDKKYMFYSCGDYTKEDDSLEDAQENKANCLVKLIDPKPGEKILDLGPGWIGMLRKIYEVTGSQEHLTGYTLSKEQKRYMDKNYGFNVEIKDFITSDYKENSFDKILSIETFEHVRERELLPLCQKLSRAIKPTGKIILQLFCQISDLPHPVLLAGGLDIFPGSELSAFKKHLDAFERAELRVTHHSILDYRPTLRAWFELLAQNKEKAIKLAGIGNYNRYLCYFAGAWRLFNDRNLLIMRVVLEPM